MKNGMKLFVVALFCTLFNGYTQGSIRIEFRPFSSGTNAWVTMQSQFSGFPITINDAQPGFWRARADNPLTENIGHIRLFPSNPQNLITFLVTNQNGHVSDAASPLPPGARSWAGFETTGERVTLQASIINNLFNGDIGPVEIVRLDFGNSILGNITHDSLSGNDLSVINAINLPSPFTISTLNGDLANIVLTGSCTGSILATASSTAIGDIIVVGELGTSTTPATISSRNGIGDITAQSINATIHADDGNFSSTTIGPIRSVTTTGAPGIPGDMSGQIRATHLIGGTININGSVLGEIRLANMFGNGPVLPVTSDPAISIGDSLGASGIIKLPFVGLAGEIIINANNSGGVWSNNGKVQLGITVNQVPPLVLTSADYADLPIDIGGGSAGLAPFALHNEACVPFNGDQMPLIPGAVLPDVRLRHYGPVLIAIPGVAPVTVSRREACSADTFVDVTVDFTFFKEFNTRGTVVVEPIPPAVFEYGYEYLISPTTNLQSVFVTGNPMANWAADYTVVVKSDCAGDTNGNGVVNIDDLVAVLNGFGGSGIGDINCNGLINIDDLVAVLNAFGDCIPQPLQGGGGSGGSGSFNLLEVAPQLNQTQCDLLLECLNQIGQL